MSKIRIAIVGVGNCASSLVQGISFYGGACRNGASVGLMHRKIGPYLPNDIEVVAAFDIDRRKIGKDVSEAIFAAPNCTKVFCDKLRKTGTTVKMGCVLDGVADHMSEYAPERTFQPMAKESTRERVISEMKNSGAQILVNYLPVGSEEATRFYVGCALEAGLALVNNIPVFIASDPAWVKRFEEKNLPLVGDDIKAQMGATVLHRTIVDLFRKRGVKVERTYQLNTGGNTDFLNMLNRTRLASKKESKTEAVQSVIGARLSDDNIHIGPSDYVPWQNDNKVCFIRVEGRLFGNVPMELDVKLSVEDSPNSAGVAIDAIRCCQLALDRGEGGVIHSASSYFCKHPPVQVTDDEAYQQVEDFIANKRASKVRGKKRGRNGHSLGEPVRRLRPVAR
ncbi:MAG: inositol-3-phosphate synthase [Verrucomicrobiota bacterium]|nr:inositol-3-phosphate synthase [Verrucomicrobiota bacterium]